jgi:hypothetical protein
VTSHRTASATHTMLRQLSHTARASRTDYDKYRHVRAVGRANAIARPNRLPLQ